MKQFILLSTVLFVTAWIGGFIASLYNPDIVGGTMDSLLPVADTLLSLEDWQLFLVIFLNNTLKAFMAMILGAFFGIMPAIMLLANGFLLGIVHFMLWKEGSALAFFTGILPHGVIEIPAFILASAFGFKLAFSFWRTVYRKEDRFTHDLRNSLTLFAKFILPALFIASMIETYITPLLIL